MDYAKMMKEQKRRKAYGGGNMGMKRKMKSGGRMAYGHGGEAMPKAKPC